jgi:nucleoside-diphosphate-sugar epimerase
MRVLVTGSTGFIGINLVRELLKRGYKVNCLYRDILKTKELAHPNIALYKGDILEYESIKTAISGCNKVFHTAAFTDVWTKMPETIHRLNVEGTANVLDAALSEKVRDVVITSTAGVFGHSGTGIIDELHTVNITHFSDYEKTKQMAENLALSYIPKGLNVIIVNPTRVFGPGVMNDSNSVTRLIDLYISGKWRIIPGNGDSIGNYAYINDVVLGHILAMEKGDPGEKYLLGGENISYNDLFSILSDVSGKRYFMLHTPFPLMLSISYLSLGFTILTGIKPLITPSLVRKFNFNFVTSSQKASTRLGYRITPFRQGLSKTIEWLGNRNKNMTRNFMKD